jgi:hypothetical protein
MNEFNRYLDSATTQPVQHNATIPAATLTIGKHGIIEVLVEGPADIP